jgi:hypothetical protein
MTAVVARAYSSSDRPIPRHTQATSSRGRRVAEKIVAASSVGMRKPEPRMAGRRTAERSLSRRR